LPKKYFSGVGDPPLKSPGRRSRDVACNVPMEDRGMCPPLTPPGRGKVER